MAGAAPLGAARVVRGRHFRLSGGRMSPPIRSLWATTLLPFLPSRRALLWVAAGAAAAVLAAAGGIRAYEKISAARFTQTGEALLKEGRWREAADFLRKAQRRDPRNPRAFRLMRDLALQAASPHTVDWAESLYRIEPSAANLGDWVNVALRFARPESARRALELAGPAHGGSASYHILDSMVHASGGRVPEAVAAMERAAALDPLPERQVTLASLRLKHPQAEVRREGEAALRVLAADPAVRAQALRELLAWHASGQRWTEAAEAAAGLQSDPPREPALLAAALEAAWRLGLPSAEDWGERLMERCPEEPAAVPAALAAMERCGQGARALEHWKRWEPALRDHPETAAIALALLDRRGARKEVRAHLDRIDWTGLDFVPMILESNAVSETEWRAWARRTDTTPQQVMRAAYFAHAAGRPAGAEILLWDLSRHPAAGDDALRALVEHYQKERNTAGMRRAAQVLASRHPEDTAAQSQRVLLDLLTEPDSPSARQAAGAVAARFPDHPGACFARALARALAGDGKGAWAAWQEHAGQSGAASLPPFHESLLRRAAGQEAEALRLASPALLEAALPEERALWNRFAPALP